MGQHLDKAPKGAYDAIVYIDGSEVVAEDANGRKIASGVAGTDDSVVWQSLIDFLYASFPDGYKVFVVSGSNFIFSSTVVISGPAEICGQMSLGGLLISPIMFTAPSLNDSVFRISEWGSFQNLAFYDVYNGIEYSRSGGFAHGLDVSKCLFKDVRNIGIYFNCPTCDLVGPVRIQDNTFMRQAAGKQQSHIAVNSATTGCITAIYINRNVIEGNANISVDLSTSGILEIMEFNGNYLEDEKENDILLKIASCASSAHIQFGGMIDGNLFTGPATTKSIDISMTLGVIQSIHFGVNWIYASPIRVHNDAVVGGQYIYGIVFDGTFLFCDSTFSSSVITNDVRNIEFLNCMIGGVITISSSYIIHLFNNRFSLPSHVYCSYSNTFIMSKNLTLVGGSLVLHLSHNAHQYINQNPSYPTESSGSSTGTGSEQTIAHGLAAIPTGCKAWIKYLVGARYITEMIPFDATNIYPTVASGLAYEWRIE